MMRIEDPEGTHLAQAVAERSIERVLHAYCQGVDRRAWDQIRDCYHPDATDSHGAYSGNVDGLLDFIERRHQTVISSMHALSNISIRFAAERDRALVESYCVSYQQVKPDSHDPFADPMGQSTRTTIACRYVDVFENRPGVGWRIHRRDVVFEWMRREQDSAYVGLDSQWQLSRRDPSDLFVSQRAEFPIS